MGTQGRTFNFMNCVLVRECSFDVFNGMLFNAPNAVAVLLSFRCDLACALKEG